MDNKRRIKRRFRHRITKRVTISSDYGDFLESEYEIIDINDNPLPWSLLSVDSDSDFVDHQRKESDQGVVEGDPEGHVGGYMTVPADDTFNKTEDTNLGGSSNDDFSSNSSDFGGGSGGGDF